MALALASGAAARACATAAAVVAENEWMDDGVFRWLA